VYLVYAKSRKPIVRILRVYSTKIKHVSWLQWRSVISSVAVSGGDEVNYINTPLCTVLSRSFVFVMKDFNNFTIKIIHSQDV
jgi:hypothetical protein